MTKIFKCADVGKDCGWSTRADDMYTLMQKISRHAEHKHDITEISTELKEKINLAIKEERTV